MINIRDTKRISITVILIAFIFLLSWIFNIESIIFFSGNNSNMKFNTSLLFILSGVFSLYLIDHKHNIKNIVLFIISSISFISLLSYKIPQLSVFDNLFIQDTYSNLYPGKMSPATSLLFIIISLIFLFSNKVRYKKLILFLHGIIFTIAFISITTYVLGIRIEEKSLFFKSLSLQTSILFIILSLSISLKNKDFFNLFFSEKQGSLLLKYFLPIIILIPFILSKYLIYTKAIEGVTNITSLKIFTIIMVLTNTLLLLILAIWFNHNEDLKIQIGMKLKSSNLKLNNILDAINEVTIIEKTDKKGKIIDINKKFEEISQYSKDEIIGKTHKIISSNFHNKSFYNEMWSKIGIGKIWIGDIKNKAKNGNYYWVQTAIIPILNDNKTVKEYISIKRDITEQKEQINTLNKKHIKQLEKEKVELEQLAYVTSHYLIEPLRIINIFSNILKTELVNTKSSETVYCLESITNSTIQIEKVVKGLLKYQKIGKKFNLSPINTNSLLGDLKNEFIRDNSMNKTFLEFNNLHNIFGDQYLIKILMTQFIENTIKFSKESEALKMIIRSSETDLFWNFEVIDNGIGIKEIDKERIFEIFQQLNKGIIGNGLGLAICKKIIQLHQGEINIESKIDVGTKIKFSIKKTLNENFNRPT